MHQLLNEFFIYRYIITSVKVHRCRKEPHFDAICVHCTCELRVSFVAGTKIFPFVCIFLSCVLFSLEFLHGLSSAVSGPVKVGEEHEEDCRVKQKEGRDQFRVAAIEDKGLRAMHEYQEELHLKNSIIQRI